MILKNRLGIINQIELAKTEERLSKQRAKELFDSGDIAKVEVGTFKGLSYIHNYLFGEIYEFAGEIRGVNISKGGFRFAPLIYLEVSLQNIDKMPQNSFDEIVEKYVEMMWHTHFERGMVGL
jgi:cell filamentation protein